MEPALDAQGEVPLPQPDTLPAVAGKGCTQQSGKTGGQNQQRNGEAGQRVAGRHCQQQAQPAGDAGGQKEDAAAVPGVGRCVRRRNKTRQHFL